jgi:hypothetical protein
MLTRRKRFAFAAVAALMPLSLLLLVTEVHLRVKRAAIRSTEARRELDAELGWRPTPNLVREGTAIDALRRPSPFRMTQNAHGFRLWSDTTTDRPRVFVLGDSYTQSDDIDDTKTFSARLAARMPDAAFWAYGCSGFGNFQQLLVLQQHVSEIKPDVLLLQLSSNDVINNLLELEDAMPFLATPGPRPYLLDDGSVKFHFASRDKGLRKYSLAYGALHDRIGSLLFGAERWVPGQIRQYGKSRNPDNFEELLEKAVVKTADLLRKMKEAIGPDARLIAFYDEDVPPLSDALKRACILADVRLIDTIGPTLMAEEGRQGKFVYRTLDMWHWNDAGHEVVAQVLEGPLRDALKLDSDAVRNAPATKIAREAKPGEPAR